MERISSSSVLLPQAKEDATNEAFMNEDASSGYDSSDASDVESDSSEETSISSQTDNQSVPDILRVRSTQLLSEDLKSIMTLPEMCDVTFLVGPTEVPVYGVRAIMAMRSRVFYQLILKHIQIAALQKKAPKRFSGSPRFSSERIVIPVRKYDPKVFRMLIEFVHSGIVSLTVETGCIVELSSLSNACFDFIDRNINVGNSEVLLQHATQYKHHKSAQKIFDKIYSVLPQRVRGNSIGSSGATSRGCEQGHVLTS